MSHLRDWEIEAELASDMEPSDDEDHVEEDIHFIVFSYSGTCLIIFGTFLLCSYGI